MDAISGDETLPADDVERAPDALPVVDRAHYDILSEHARGGLGRILRARDRRTGRLVAIKEMLHEATDAAARFQREAMITANLQHPAIVPVYELGQWTDGEPFYAMKLVAGRSLDKVIADARTRDDRLALLPRLIDVAEAMAYAHGEGVIHRDLKPANVLVGAFGETVVIDWGLAKRRGDTDAPSGDARVASRGDMTVAGAVMGTPVYMPPEQARGEQVDARADVYALGAMLYHLLSGRLPYGESRSADEVLAKVKAGPPRPLAELEPGVPADLLAIVAKAMAPERDARYATAGDLAKDLRRFQTGQLVGAHAYSAWQLLRRWLHRYRAAVGVAVVLVAALAVTAIIAVRRITAERNVAQRERADADRQRALVEARNNHLIVAQARGNVAIDPTRALAWLKQLPAGAAEWADARLIASDAREHGVARWVLDGHAGNVNDVAFAPDARTLVSAGDDRTIRIWDLSTGASRVLDEALPVEFVDFVAGGARIVSLGFWYADAARGRRIVVWEVASGTPHVLPPGDRDAGLLVAPDGNTAAVIGCHGELRIVDLTTLGSRPLRAAQVLAGGYCTNAMTFSADGRLIAAETARSTIDLIDVADGRVLRTFATQDDDTVSQLAFTPDGARLLVLTSVDLASWGVERGDRQLVVANRGAVRAFATNRDGTRLALAGDDHTVRAWTLADGSYEVIASHRADLTSLNLAPDQHRVVSSSEDGELLISDLDERVARSLRGHGGEVFEAVISGDGQWIASASGDGTVRVWSMDGARRSWDSPAQVVTELALTAGAAPVLISAFDGTVERWTLDGAHTVLRAAATPDWHPNPIVATADGRVVAAARVDGGLDVWSDGGAPRTLAAPMVLAGLAVSDDGAQLAWVAQDGAVELATLGTDAVRRLSTPALEARRRRAIALASGVLVWGEAGGLGVHDLATGATRTLAGTAEVRVAVLAPDAATALTLSPVGEVRRWELARGSSSPLFTVATDSEHRNFLAMSPDGAWVACGSADFTIQLAELATGRVRTLRGHTGEIRAVAFSADGSSLASASADTTVRLWDVATGAPRVIPHHEEVYAVGFRPDGRVVTVTRNGAIAVVLDDVPRDEAGLRAFVADATNLVVDPEAP